MSRRRRRRTTPGPPPGPDAERVPLPADFAAACPHCSKALDCHEAAKRQDDGTLEIQTDARPAPGDFTMCLGCGEPSRYGAGGHLRALTPDDETDISPEMRRIFTHIQTARVGAMFSFKAAGGTWMGREL